MREKVARAARELGLDVSPTTLDAPTRTAQQAALAVGCETSRIAKSIVFVADGEPILCVASGAHRISLDRLCDALDCAEARPASPEEVRVATGFAIGGVPPFAHSLSIVFDTALLEHPRVWAAGGDGNTLFEVDPRRLADCTRATVATIGEDADDERG